jgi:hypothetical protein
MTWCGDVAMSARGEVSWTDVNLTGQKIKKIHVVDSVSINGQ